MKKAEFIRVGKDNRSLFRLVPAYGKALFVVALYHMAFNVTAIYRAYPCGNVMYHAPLAKARGHNCKQALANLGYVMVTNP